MGPNLKIIRQKQPFALTFIIQKTGLLITQETCSCNTKVALLTICPFQPALILKILTGEMAQNRIEH
jgi:hypothetical protein